LYLNIDRTYWCCVLTPCIHLLCIASTWVFTYFSCGKTRCEKGWKSALDSSQTPEPPESHESNELSWSNDSNNGPNFSYFQRTLPSIKTSNYERHKWDCKYPTNLWFLICQNFVLIIYVYDQSMETKGLGPLKHHFSHNF
jgi:hypothetical protein